MKHIFGDSILLLLLLVAATAGAHNVEQQLRSFDDQADVTAANHFFAELQKADFLAEPIVFSASDPVDSLRQQVWYWAAEWFYEQQDYARSEHYALQALPLYHGGNDELPDCLNLLGLIYVRQGDFARAALYAKRCLEIDLRSGDDDRIASIMNTVAGIYMAGYQASEAEQYILGALKHIDRVDNPPRRAVILGMASEVYHALADDQRALTYADEAYRIDSLLGRQPQMAIRLSQKASALLGLHRYQEAEAIYRQVIPVFQQVGDVHSMAIAHNRLGMSLLCQERQREAIPHYREAAALFSRMGDLYNEIHAHRGLCESYWKLDPDSAKLELDYFDLLKDSLYKHSTADALSRYNAEFSNDLLQQENAAVRQAHRRSVILAVGLILLIVLAAVLIIRHIRRCQQVRIQELVREIEQLKALKPAPQPAESETPAEETEELPDESRQFLMRVIETVNEGLASGDYSVETIASNLNMSVSTFRRRLLGTAGESPKAYISAIQMERATTLLTDNPDMPISRVARLCGFDETSSFGHTFKRVYGCSPTQFRGGDQGDPLQTSPRGGFSCADFPLGGPRGVNLKAD